MFDTIFLLWLNSLVTDRETLLGEIAPPTPDAKLFTPVAIRQRGRTALIASGLINVSGEPHQLQLLEDLEPTVAANLNRHDEVREFWVPRDFFPLDQDGKIIYRAEDLGEEAPLLSPTAQAAMVLNLLTEDNLPAYHRTIASNFGLDGAWGTWVNKWTAEEGRHAYVMRAFLDLTGAVDTQQLEEDRLKHMEAGYGSDDKDPLHALAYVSFQELATRISHRNTGKACKDSLANEMLLRISKDENLHMLFYRNLVSAAFEIAPNQTMRAVADEVMNFEMPGAGMKGFKSKSLLIARGGIYNLRTHQKLVINPILREWKVFSRDDLTGDGELARQELEVFLRKLDKRAGRFEESLANGTLDKIIARVLTEEVASA